MKKSKQQEQIAALRDKALALLRSGKHKAALESITALEELEPEQPDWPRRAAECHRGLDDRGRQIEALGRAAERYAAQGALAKATAMSRMILNLDPHHAPTRKRLLELQGGPAAVDALPPALAAPEPPQRRRLVAPPPPENPEPPSAVKAEAAPRPSLEQVLRQRRAASPRRPPAEASRESPVEERQPIAVPIPEEPAAVAEQELEPVAVPASEPIVAFADSLGPEPEIVPDELEISSMPAPRPSVPASPPSPVTASSPTPVPPSDEAVTLRPARSAAGR